MSVIHKLVDAHPITVAQSIATVGKQIRIPASAKGLTVEVNFAWGSAGTTAKLYVQTSFDFGATWIDIMAFAFTTAVSRKILAISEGAAQLADIVVTDGTLTDDTAVDGILGDRIRARVVTTGTYATATTISAHAKAKIT